MFQFIIENHAVTTIICTLFVCIPMYAITDTIWVCMSVKK